MLPKSAEGAEHLDLLKKVDDSAGPAERLTEDRWPEVMAPAAEFVSEGFHLNRRLNC